MRKGLQKIKIFSPFLFLKSILLLTVFFVSVENITGQNPIVCSGGTLTGADVLDAMGVSGADRLVGNFSLTSTTPPGGETTITITDGADNESDSFSGFDVSVYSEYEIHYDGGSGYDVTYQVVASPPTVSLSTIDPSSVCVGDEVSIDITLIGSGIWNVYLDETSLGVSSYTLSASGSGTTHRLNFTLSSNSTFEITSVVAYGNSNCSVDPADLPSPLSFSVLPDPSAQSVTGTNGCDPASLNDITLLSSEVGVEYYIVYNDGSSISEVSGTRWTGDGGAHIFPGVNDGTGEYYVVAMGCHGEVKMGGSFYISTPPATTPSISSSSPACPGTDLIIDNTEGSDVQYYLLRDGSRTGAYKNGNNGAITFGGLTTPGTYTIEAERHDCVVAIPGSFEIQALPSFFTLSANQTSYCAGTTPTGVELSLAGSESAIQYQLQRNDGSGFSDLGSPVIGDGNALSWVNISEGAYRVVASSTAGCSTIMSGTPVIVEYDPPTAVITSSSPNSRCEGSSVDFNINVTLTGTQPFSFDIINNVDGSVISVSNYFFNTYSVSVDPSTDIIYTLTNLTDASGCDPVMDVGQTQFFVRPAPVFTFDASPNPVSTVSGTSTTSVCVGSEVTLDVNVSNSSGPFDYVWSSGSAFGTTKSVSFNPNTTRTYDVTIENEFGCTATRQIEVIVNPLPTVDFEPDGGDYDVCINGGDVELIPDAPNTGGNFSGTGVSGNFFDPVTAGVGRHSITYTFTNTSTGCENNITKDLDVNPEPNVNVQGNPTDYCYGDGAVTIGSIPQNSNGVWTIVGGTRPWFNDNGNGTASLDVDLAIDLTGGGSFDLVYQYTDPSTSCTAEDILTVDLHPDLADEIEFEYSLSTAGAGDPWNAFPAGDLTVCQTEAPINLRGIFDDTGAVIGDGHFSGPGVTDTGSGTAQFDPSVAGNGNHTITYTYTDPATTCSGTITHTVQIGTTLEFPGLNPLYCASDGPISVYGDEVPASGVSGTLAIFDNTNPASPSLIYSQANNSSANPFSFDPSAEGSGEYLFRFTYNDGLCDNIIEEVVTVAAAINASFTINAPSTQFCETQGPVELVPSQGGGTFSINTSSGGGVAGYYFNPSHPDVIPGNTYTITYTINTGSCTDSYSMNVSVISVPTLDISGLSGDYCDNDGGPFLIEPNNGGIAGAVYTFSTTLNAVGRSPLYYDDGSDTTHVASYTYTGASGDPLFFDPVQAGYGTYTITYTFDNTANTGCITSVSRTVTVHETPGVTFAGMADPVEYCQSDAPVTLQGSFVGGGFTGEGNFFGAGINNATPDDGVAEFDPSSVIPGDHPIQYVYYDPVTGCNSEKTKTFTVKETPAVYNVTPNSSTSAHPGHFCPGDNVEIGVDDSQDGVDYLLIRNGNIASPVETISGNASVGAITFSPVNVPGDYTVLAIWPSPSGCSQWMNGTVEVRENNVTASYTKQNVSCPGDTNGKITVSASGGSGPYWFYLYNDAALSSLVDDNNSGNFSGLSAQVYYVQIEDAIGCMLPAPVEVNISEPASGLSVTTDSSPSGCAGCTAGVDCEGEAWVTIADGTAFADLITYPSGYDVQWTDGSGSSVTATGDGTAIEKMPAGFYTVRVTDANGCWIEEVIEIESVPAITLTEVSRSHVSCHGAATGQLVVEAAGGDPAVEYQFSIDGVNWLNPDVAGGNQRTFAGLTAGTYNVFVRDLHYPRCEYQLGTAIVISEPSALSISEVVSSHSDVDCYGNATGQFEVVAAGGSGSFEYSLNGGAFGADKIFTGLMAGSYSVTVRDINGCTAALAMPVEITQPAQLSITNTSTTPVSCMSGNDGAIAITANGGDGNYVYSITAGPETRPNQTLNTFDLLPAGTYDVSVTDGNSCVATYSGIVVDEPSSAMALSATVIQNVLCRGGNSGALSVSASGGSGNYEFSIDGGTTWVTNNTNSYIFDNLVAGSYTIDVRDDNGCMANTSETISQPASVFSLSAAVDKDVTCYDGNDGEITVEGTGGSSSSGVNYVLYKNISGSWVMQATSSNGTGASHTFTGLSAGDYRVEAWDNSGAWNGDYCSDFVEVTVDQPSADIQINTININHVTTTGGNDGSVEIEILGGSGSYSSITWSGTEESTGNPVGGLVNNVYVQPNLVAGTYSVEVTDALGCTVTSDPIVVTDPDSPLGLSISTGEPGPCYNATNGTISLTATGGVTPYTSITLSRMGTVIAPTSSGSDFANYSNLGEGTYEAEVVDNAGTSYTETITFNLPDALNLNFAIDHDVTCAGASDGSITFSVTGGTPDASVTPNTYDYFIIPSVGGVISGTVDAGGDETVATLSAGTDYLLRIVDDLGCIVETTFDINEPDPITFDIDSENLSCYGSGDGEISVTNVDGGWGSNYSYAWEVYNGTGWDPYPSSGQATTPTVNNLPVGTYRVVVTGNLHGCTATSAGIQITQPEDLELILSGQKDITTCYGDNSGEVTLRVEGGSGPYDLTGSAAHLNWSGTGTFVATGLSAGINNFNVEDAHGCTATSSATIQEPNQLVVTGVDAKIECESDGSGGELELELSGGVVNGLGEYSYRIELIHQVTGNSLVWIRSSSTQPLVINDITGIPEGNYDLFITDANSSNPSGCIYTDVVSFSYIDIQAVVDHVSCFGASDGAIDITISGGSGNYTYQWNKDGEAAIYASNQDLSGLTSGSYVLTLTDVDRGCTLVRTYKVDNGKTLYLDASVIPVSCNGGANGAIIVDDVVNAVPPVAYYLDGVADIDNDGQWTGLTAGTYQVTAIDADGCEASGSFYVPQPLSIDFSLSTSLECSAGYSRSITLSGLTGGTAPYSFTWSGPGGFTQVSDEEISDITVGGTYSVTVTDHRNCSVTKSITVFGKPVLTALTTPVKCNGGSNGIINLTVSGGSANYTYSWDDPSSSVSQDLSGLLAGNYQVVVTDHSQICAVSGNPYTATLAVEVTEPAPFVIDSYISHVDCGGVTPNGEINITSISGGSGSYTLTWDASPYITQGDWHQTDLPGGEYTVVITDADGCSVTRSFTVDEPDPLSFILDVDPSNCLQENSITITSPSGGTGSYEYIWAGPGVDTSSSFLTTQTNLPGGEYTVTMVDVGNAHNCNISKSVTLSKPLNATHTVKSETCPGANNGAINLTVIGGVSPYTYSWSTSDGSGLSVTEEDQSGLSAGTYEVVITDSNPDGPCSITISDIEVEVANTISIGSDITHVRCFGASTGAININVTGGSGAYSYIWNGPDGFNSVNQNISGLKAGSYTVVVTDVIDGTSCSVTRTFAINEPATPIVVTDVSVDSVKCRGAATGAIDITVGGGTGPYSFQWTGPGIIPDPTLEDLNNIRSGDYNVVITDANGCILDYSGAYGTTINVPQPDEALSVALVHVDHVTTTGGDDGAIEVDVEGGTGSYTILWFDDSGNPVAGSDGLEVVNNLEAGTYRVYVEDEYGCSDEILNIVVTEPNALLELVISKRSVGKCNGDGNGEITVDMIGGTLPYQSITLYDGSGQVDQVTNQNNVVFSGLAAGDYEVSGIDANGVEVRKEVTLLQPTALQLNATVSQQVECYSATTGIIEISVGGGVADEIGGNYYVTLSGGPFGTADNYSPTSGEVFTFSNLPAGSYTVRVIDDSNVNEVNYDNDTFTDGYGDGLYNINTDCYLEQKIVIEQPEAELLLSTVTGSEELCEGELPMLQIITSNWDVAARPLEVQLSDGETYIVNSSPYQFQPNNVPAVGITQYTITGFVEQGTACNKGTASGTATVEVHPLPTATIFGDAELCLGESRDVAIELTGTSPWEVVISDGTNSWNQTFTGTFNLFTVTPAADASYEILSVSDVYCSNTGTGTANITVHELPEVTLSGNAEICEGQSTDLTFEFTAGTGPWTVTFTENGTPRTVGPIINNTFDLSVSPLVTTDYELVSLQDANGCQQSVSGSVRVTVRPFPEQPAPIVGNDIVCQGSIQTYSVDPVANATGYVWSLPTGATILSGDGTREIEVQFANDAVTGNISVYAQNNCGPGPNRTLQINVDERPLTIGAIAGPEDLCQGSTAISYSVTPVADASKYNWTVPTGFFIVSGQGTAKIVVELDPALDATIGDITVTPENNCGISDVTSTLEVEVHPLPQADAGGDQQVCGNTTTMSAADPSVINADWQGTWEVVSGYADIASPNDPNTSVSNISRGDVVLRWTVTNIASGSNGCSISDEVTLRNNQLTVIADAEKTLTCDATSNLYATPIPAYSNTSGRWSVESGSGIFDDATSPSTSIYDLAPGSNIIRWTITQNGCDSYAEVEIVNDQPDQAVIYDQDVIDLCSDDTILVANDPVEGIGVWTVEKGRATITPIGGNDYEVRLTNLARGENVIRWTITKNGHCSTFDEVVIRNNQLDVEAGDDFTTCQSTVQLMATEPPAGVVGYWTALDAASGSATFADGTSYQTEVSGLVNGDNRLRWTLYKNGCESSDEIVITSMAPTQATVGSEQRICKSDTVLSGNTPAAYEVGRWSVVQGSGDFVDVNDPKTRVTNVGLGVNIYRWTIFNGNCSSSADLKVINQQVVAFAGKDTVSCSRYILLDADPVPAGYSGLWTIEPGSGGAVFDGDAGNPNVGVQLAKGENILRWNVVHNQSGCSSSDVVNILVNTVDNVDAGGDQIINDGSGEATMQADLQDRATGVWSIISGGGDILDPTDPTTIIRNLVRGPNIFRWTVTIGNCSAYDEVQVTNGDVIEAETGPDIYTCSDEATMNANDPENAIGKWTLGRFGSGKFENERDPKTRVYDIGPGQNEFVWTISYGQGTSFSSDTIIVINNRPDDARAGANDYTCSESYTLLGNTPDAGMGSVSWKTVSGSGTLLTPDQPQTDVVGLSQGENRFVYTIEKGSGSRVCYSTDTVTIINGIATQAIAGEDQTLCTDSAKLEPNIPNHGTGEWRILDGAAEFDGNMARNIARGTNRFLWVISTEYCSSTDTVTIVNNTPSIPNAGRDIAVCEDSVVLSGSLDIYHTGEWSLISGSGTIEDPTRPDTKVTNLGVGENRFRWTITNGNCSDFDDVVISNDFKEAIIRYDASTPLCVDTTALEANNPSPGIGTWGIIGGSGSAEFVDPEDPYTVVRNLQQGENLLTWSITNGECTDVDTVRIVNNQPTTADAGDNAATCDNYVHLTANIPVVGTGSWTIRNGGGKFSALDNPSARVDSLKFGANIFRWTIEHEGCRSFDDVQIDYNTIQAEVGDSRTICSDTEILQGNSPLPGTGTWTVVGGTSQAYFDDINNPNTTVRNLRKGVNRLRWTINYKGCQTYEEVSITNAMPSTAYAGNTQPLCSDETVLDALEPEIGTGHWEVIAGSATIAGSDITNPKAAVSGLAKGENVLRWIVENGICRSSDEVLILNNLPSEPFAGGDIEVCEPNHDLRALTPEYGSGLWSIIEGGGYIADVTDPSTEIKNLVPGVTKLKWTVSQGQCTLSDTIVIENNTPTQANAGPDVADCKDWAQLDANPALYGTGEWYLVSGTGSFQNPGDESTLIENLGFGENILMWEIWNGTKCYSRDTVKIFNKVPEQSDAGNDKTICENYTTLNGNYPPDPAIGTWTVVSGAGTFDDPNSPSSIVSDIGFGENVFKWTISYDECKTESTVTVRSNKTDAYAGEDVVVYDPEAILNANNVGDLDAKWEIVGGTGDFEDATFFNTRVTGLSEGTNTFRWTISVDECDSYDDVSVEYRPTPDAGFITDVDEGCWPLTVNFINYSVDVQERNYHWDFGDGNSSGDQNPSHTFDVAGEFPVVLTVPGPDGTEGRYQKVIRVYDHPEAGFSVMPETVYVPGDEVRFFDLSTGAVRYLWDFGDGNSSEEAHPVHEYAQSGVYDVTLHVTNEHDCVDSVTVVDAVTAISQGFIKFPNAFKPRPDGGTDNRPNETNNIFKPVYRDVDEYHLQIFNRWGQLIYESRDVEEGWNGFYKGQLAPQAVYVWKVSGTFVNGREFRDTGTVLLVR
ncbi:PKD domain-containing protein [Thermophagus sp. OGC60D27]|uniref:PKD domain-containing protein n=1 Tax=Thermophagus sp. OGC60D27 TaxID=3458415 RepID=UPI004037FE98